MGFTWVFLVYVSNSIKGCVTVGSSSNVAEFEESVDH